MTGGQACGMLIIIRRGNREHEKTTMERRPFHVVVAIEKNEWVIVGRLLGWEA